ncbi:hypothetical protein [Neobacillus muris]|uniref:hypothetical protein n=1 Tax=Neobacillus muris TaxID=2941334 RepID=UPI00203C2006|nr:hypothetical protein [Neobacillus muris]
MKGEINIGTYISLSILPNNILQSEWEKVYEESLELVKAFAFAHVEEREYWGFRVLVYAQAHEKLKPEKHWAIVGDLRSKQYAETFKLYRDLNKYKVRKVDIVASDILFQEDQQVWAFDSKTQGYQYHLYILAIAMLIESRFPKSAIVSGDIDFEQCIKSKEWANQHLSQPVDLPIRVQVNQLLSRFPDLNSESEKIQVIEKLLIADSEKMFTIFYTHFTRESFHLWFCNKLQTYSSPTQVGALSLLIYYLNVSGDLNNLLYIACRAEKGPKFPPFEFIKALARTWIFLPREKFSFLKHFDNVAGHPHIVERQFGTIILDLRFSGREIKSFIPLKEVVNTLVLYFPELDSGIEGILRQEMSRIEEELLAFQNQIRPAIELSNASTEDKKFLADEDAFLYFDEDTVKLTNEQDLMIKGIAFSINTLLEQEGEGVLKWFFYGSIRNLKRIFTGLFIEKYNSILTENAWRWINDTEDPRLVRILVAKLIIDEARGLKHQKVQSDIRKAMLENKALTQKIADYMDSEVAMKQIEEIINKNK